MSSPDERDAETRLPGRGNDSAGDRSAETVLPPRPAPSGDRSAPTNHGTQSAGSVDAVGTVVKDRYEILSELGRGGMGVVWEVRDTLLGQTFALKRLAPELAARPEFVSQFLREASSAMAFSVRSERFVTTYGVDIDSTGPFLVMERVADPTLRTVLRAWNSGNRPSVERIAALVREIAIALSELHGAGFLHRDLKPENIFAEPSGDGWRVKLADFGLTRDVEDGTRTSIRGAGTSAYASPEQKNGLPTSAASDVFSLGALAYECFSGELPEGAFETLAELINDFPEPLSTTVQNCLSKRVEKRPTLPEVAEALAKPPASPSEKSSKAGGAGPAKRNQLQDPPSTAQSADTPNPQAIAVPPPRPAPPKHPLLDAYVEALRPIPAGAFTMGSDSSKYGTEKPAHTVTLSAFRMGATPVTVGMWKEYCKATGEKMPEAPHLGWKDDHPMVNVSWHDIMGKHGNGGFCAWASKQAGIRLTLPTEAQWEYAARGGQDGLEYPWGNEFDDSMLWCSVKTRRTSLASVSRSSNIHRNGYGLTDMVGNVWEWCSDWYGAYPSESRSVPRFEEVAKGGIAGLFGGREVRTVLRDESVGVAVTNPTGPASGDYRCPRGGSWYNYFPVSFRCAGRDRYQPGSRNYIFGFRLSAGPA